MRALGKKLSLRSDGSVAFRCPGCGNIHAVSIGGMPNGWDFNGNGNAPTFFPSIEVRNGHYARHFVPGSPCWCTYNAEHPEDSAPFKCTVCHSYVTDGRINFLADCTHALAGQTVDLPDYPVRDDAEA